MSKIDTKWTADPTCPHCGEADQDWYEGLGPKEDGDTWLVENCPFCGEPYEVTMSVSHYFDTKLVPKKVK